MGLPPSSKIVTLYRFCNCCLRGGDRFLGLTTASSSQNPPCITASSSQSLPYITYFKKIKSSMLFLTFFQLIESIAICILNILWQGDLALYDYILIYLTIIYLTIIGHFSWFPLFHHYKPHCNEIYTFYFHHACVHKFIHPFAHLSDYFMSKEERETLVTPGRVRTVTTQRR